MKWWTAVILFSLSCSLSVHAQTREELMRQIQKKSNVMDAKRRQRDANEAARVESQKRKQATEIKNKQQLIDNLHETNPGDFDVNGVAHSSRTAAESAQNAHTTEDMEIAALFRDGAISAMPIEDAILHMPIQEAYQKKKEVESQIKQYQEQVESLNIFDRELEKTLVANPEARKIKQKVGNYSKPQMQKVLDKSPYNKTVTEKIEDIVDRTDHNAYRRGVESVQTATEKDENGYLEAWYSRYRLKVMEKEKAQQTLMEIRKLLTERLIQKESTHEK